jgi:hypothetical protein
MFDYVLPVEAASIEAGAKKKPGDSGKNHKKKKPDEKKQVVHTQMVGEKPGDDIGYDPSKIPVEEIKD